MNNKTHYFNFIADYKNAAGIDVHGAFKALAFPGMNEKAAARMLADDLRSRGFTPVSIISVKGNYSM